jgi:hypothetical protein
MVARNVVASMMERCWNSGVFIINCWKRAQRSGSRGLVIISGADGIELESGRSTKGTAGAWLQIVDDQLEDRHRGFEMQ